jgi:hypothetical protein
VAGGSEGAAISMRQFLARDCGLKSASILWHNVLRVAKLRDTAQGKAATAMMWLGMNKADVACQCATNTLRKCYGASRLYD